MPFTFFAHQAPIIPLKMIFPRRFCGLALAVGSMAPDLEYFFRGHLGGVVGHTFAGQFYYCLPLTLALVWLLRNVVAEPLASHVPDLGGFHLRDLRQLARPQSAGDWVKSGASALVGSFSHLFIDGFTHWNGWAVMRLPLLRAPLLTAFGHPLAGYKLLQHGGSLLLGLAALGMLHAMGRARSLRRWNDVPIDVDDEEPGVVQATPSTRRWLWGLAIAVAVVGGAAWVLEGGWDGGTWTELWLWGHLVFRVGCFFFVGLCIGCLVVGRKARRAATPEMR